MILQYDDLFVQADMRQELGQYVTSYRTSDRSVEVHVFEREGKFVFYVIKSHYVPVHDAQQVVYEALQLRGLDAKTVKTIYDSNSLGLR